MARPKETFDVNLTHVSYRDVNVRIWGTVEDRDRDVVITLSQEKAEALIADLKSAFAGIQEAKAHQAKLKYQQYLELKAQFEAAAPEATTENNQ